MTEQRATSGRDRRFVLKAALAGGAAAVLAPGVFLIAETQAREPAAAASTAQRWGLLIDVSRCAEGCTRCVDSCRAEQGWEDRGRGAADPQWIRQIVASDPQGGATITLPVMCQHCAEAPCVDVCPTGASFHRADGIVLVDRHLCIGCRYCVMACPLGARFFVDRDLQDQRPATPRGKGTAEGCTLCVHRIDAGQRPACVEACPGAMVFGDLNDADSPIRQALARHPVTRLRPDLRLGNGVQYQSL